MSGLLRLLRGMCLGMGLVGVYMVPALSYLDYIRTDQMWVHYLNYKNWFFCLYSCMDSFIVRTSLVALFQSALIWGMGGLIAWKSIGADKMRALFWVILPLTILFLMNRASLFLWDILPPLQKVQFPYRLIVMLDLAFPFVFIQMRRRKNFLPGHKRVAVVSLSRSGWRWHTAFRYWGRSRTRSMDGSSRFMPLSPGDRALMSMSRMEAISITPR